MCHKSEQWAAIMNGGIAVGITYLFLLLLEPDSGFLLLFALQLSRLGCTFFTTSSPCSLFFLSSTRFFLQPFLLL